MPISSSSILEFIGADGSKTHAGVNVTEKKALGLPAVWRAVNLIAGTAASLPLHAYRPLPQGGRQQVVTGRAADLLETPHPDMTSFELWEMVYTHIALWGNAYLRKLSTPQSGTMAAELWPIHPSRVRVGRTSDVGKKIYSVDGGNEVHDDSTLLHIPGFGYDGLCGLSPIRIARQGMGLALAAEEFGARLFGNGSLATGILQTDMTLTREDADRLQERWQAKRSGLGNAHSTIVLDKGAKFHQLSIPPEDAQFLESRSFQVSEVARMFGVPPHMLMETQKSTSWGTGIEQQSIGFVVYTLNPWLQRVEKRMTKEIKPLKVYAKYSLEGLLRGDSAQRAAFYRAMWEIGAINSNEIRALEDRGPVEGGDTYYRPLNMGELGTFDTQQAGAPA